MCLEERELELLLVLVCFNVSEFESDTCSTLLTQAASTDACWLLSVDMSPPPRIPSTSPSPLLSPIVRPSASSSPAGRRLEGRSRGSFTAGVRGSEVVAVPGPESPDCGDYDPDCISCRPKCSHKSLPCRPRGLFEWCSSLYGCWSLPRSARGPAGWLPSEFT